MANQLYEDMRRMRDAWARQVMQQRQMDQAVADERHRRDWERAGAVLRTYQVPLHQPDIIEWARAPSIERARDLFITFLDPTQRRYFEAGLPIVHEGKAGRYILGARANLIEAWLLDTTKHGPPGRYLMCVGPAGPLPQPDVFLTQLLWLRHDEERLLQTANAGRYPG